MLEAEREAIRAQPGRHRGRSNGERGSRPASRPVERRTLNTLRALNALKNCPRVDASSRADRRRLPQQKARNRVGERNHLRASDQSRPLHPLHPVEPECLGDRGPGQASRITEARRTDSADFPDAPDRLRVARKVRAPEQQEGDCLWVRRKGPSRRTEPLSAFSVFSAFSVRRSLLPGSVFAVRSAERTLSRR